MACRRFSGSRARSRPQFHLVSLVGLAGMLELVGGALLLVGLFTRPVAFVLSGEMAFAYFMAHAPHGFWPLINRGELAALYCFVFLFLAAAGPGPLERRLAGGATARQRAAKRPGNDLSVHEVREARHGMIGRPGDESNVRPAP